MSGPGIQNMPTPGSVRLPLQFVLTGVICLLVGIGFLIARPDLLASYHYSQHIVAVTHLFVLGWLACVVMGAMYQLVPVALETTLHSEKLARWQYWIHVGSLPGMVWMLWQWKMAAAGHFASILVIGIGLFVYNVARTLKKVPRWNVVAGSIAAAIFWLSAGVSMGLYVACAKCWNFSPFDPIAQMHAHAHLGMVGFFIQLMVGVSYKLVPMFMLSEVQSQRRAWWSLALLNAGLAGAFIGILLQAHWKGMFAVLTASGLAIYGIEVKAIVQARKRKALDWGLKYFFTAIGFLFPISILALVLSWPALPLTQFTGQLENVYGLLAILGVLTLGILGMLYKIIPFLVWYGSYSRQIGRTKVPMMAELYSTGLQAAGYWSYVTGLLVLSASTVMGNQFGVRIGSIVLAASLGVFAVNMLKIVSHLFHPRLEPLPARAAIQGVA